MSFFKPQQPVLLGHALHEIQETLPSTALLQQVQLPHPTHSAPLLQPCEWSQTDRLVKAVEDVFFDRAFCLEAGVVRSTTVMVNEFADGSMSFGMLQVQPDQIRTMGHTYKPNNLGIPNESVVVPLQTAFLAMANQAQLTSIPQLTIDTSVLENV